MANFVYINEYIEADWLIINYAPRIRHVYLHVYRSSFIHVSEAYL